MPLYYIPFADLQPFALWLKHNGIDICTATELELEVSWQEYLRIKYQGGE